MAFHELFSLLQASFLPGSGDRDGRQRVVEGMTQGASQTGLGEGGLAVCCLGAVMAAELQKLGLMSLVHPP